MAETMLKTKVKLAGIKGVHVSSAGLCAENGGLMSRNALSALKILGYKTKGFKTRRATGELLIKSDVIICMTESQKNRISNFPNVYTIGELTGIGEILDPYGEDLQVYIKSSHQIEDGCNILLGQIENNAAPAFIKKEKNIKRKRRSKKDEGSNRL